RAHCTPRRRSAGSLRTANAQRDMVGVCVQRQREPCCFMWGGPPTLAIAAPRCCSTCPAASRRTRAARSGLPGRERGSICPGKAPPSLDRSDRLLVGRRGPEHVEDAMTQVATLV